MDTADLTASYQLISELLLNPDERDPERVESLRHGLEGARGEVHSWITKFLATAGSTSRDEYVQTLELSPPCPLYLGSYLFDEPTTCNGVGTSGRNVYMLELAGIYSHFGFDITARELPDYLPAIVDFLWISLANQDRDGIGLRRRFVEQYVFPGLQPLKAALPNYVRATADDVGVGMETRERAGIGLRRGSVEKYVFPGHKPLTAALQKDKSPYALLVSALQSAVEQDLSRMADDAPAWKPAEEASGTGVSLPVLSKTPGGYTDLRNGYEAGGYSARSEFAPNACGTGGGNDSQGSE